MKRGERKKGRQLRLMWVRTSKKEGARREEDDPESIGISLPQFHAEEMSRLIFEKVGGQG